MLSATTIVGIAAGTSVGSAALVALTLVCIKRWIQGPTKGTDSTKRLDNRVVVITGKYLIFPSSFTVNKT